MTDSNDQSKHRWWDSERQEWAYPEDDKARLDLYFWQRTSDLEREKSHLLEVIASAHEVIRHDNDLASAETMLRECLEKFGITPR